MKHGAIKWLKLDGKIFRKLSITGKQDFENSIIYAKNTIWTFCVIAVGFK